MANSFIEIDNKLMEIELSRDKAALICSDIKEEYFGEAEPEDWFLKAYYDSSETKMQIILNYLCMMRKSVEKMRTLLNQEFKKKSEKAA